VLGPFEVEKRPLTLHPKGSKPATGSTTAGPVGWWKLDEKSGGTAANASGNKLTGTLYGKPRWSPDGVRGGALELDGERNWIEFADSANLDLRGGLTVAVWIKPRAGDKSPGTLLAKGEAWQLQRLGGKGHLEFSLTGPAINKKGKRPIATFKQPLKDNEWYHVVGVYDGKRSALYVDGEEKDGDPATGAIAVNNVPVTLGENITGRGRLFNGWLDEARLYTRGLSAAEVKALYRERAK